MPVRGRARTAPTARRRTGRITAQRSRRSGWHDRHARRIDAEHVDDVVAHEVRRDEDEPRTLAARPVQRRARLKLLRAEEPRVVEMLEVPGLVDARVPRRLASLRGEVHHVIAIGIDRIGHGRGSGDRPYMPPQAQRHLSGTGAGHPQQQPRRLRQARWHRHERRWPRQRRTQRGVVRCRTDEVVAVVTGQRAQACGQTLDVLLDASTHSRPIGRTNRDSHEWRFSPTRVVARRLSSRESRTPRLTRLRAARASDRGSRRGAGRRTRTADRPTPPASPPRACG